MPDKPAYPETIAGKLDRLGLLLRNGLRRGRFYDWLMELDLCDHLSRPTRTAVEKGFAEVWRVVPDLPAFSVHALKEMLPENPFLSAWEDLRGVYLGMTGLRENLADPADLPKVTAAMRDAGLLTLDGRATAEALADGRAKLTTEEILGWLDEGLRSLHEEFEKGRKRKRTQ